jgi:hypothetical protein
MQDDNRSKATLIEGTRDDNAVGQTPVLPELGQPATRGTTRSCGRLVSALCQQGQHNCPFAILRNGDGHKACVRKDAAFFTRRTMHLTTHMARSVLCVLQFAPTLLRCVVAQGRDGHKACVRKDAAFFTRRTMHLTTHMARFFLCVLQFAPTLLRCVIAQGQTGKQLRPSSWTNGGVRIGPIDCMPPSAAPSILVLWKPCCKSLPSSRRKNHGRSRLLCRHRSPHQGPGRGVAAALLPRPGDAAGVAALVAVACALSYVTNEAMVCPRYCMYRSPPAC